MSLFKIAEKFVISKLKSIKKGNLKLVNYDGKVYHFGDLENLFTAEIKVINPKFYLNIILGGSSALGEAHINKGERVRNSKLASLRRNAVRTIKKKKLDKIYRELRKAHKNK